MRKALIEYALIFVLVAVSVIAFLVIAGAGAKDLIEKTKDQCTYILFEEVTGRRQLWLEPETVYLGENTVATKINSMNIGGAIINFQTSAGRLWLREAHIKEVICP
jgi:hypothetical protein